MLGKIEKHKHAARKLNIIKNKAFELIRQNIGNISEYEVQQFILSEFEKENLVTDEDDPIVAVNKNSSTPHYFPSRNSQIIRKGDIVLIDLWAKLKEENSLFADITWMGYTGKNIPKSIRDSFNKVIKARDTAVEYIKSQLNNKNLPKTSEVDKVVRSYFDKQGVEKYFKHKTGHSLGVSSPHGKPFNLSKSSKKNIEFSIPFTIEPGLYFKNKFGVRSEIDCYISENYLSFRLRHRSLER